MDNTGSIRELSQETIDKIAAVETDRRDRPVNDVKIITIKLHEEQ